MANSVKELRRLAEKESKTEVLLYNPLLKDFSTKFDGYDEVVLKAGQIVPVTGAIAERVKKQLITFILNERKLNSDVGNMEKIAKEIEVVF